MSTPLDQAQPENVTFSHSWTITDFSYKLESSIEHPCLTSCTFPSTSSITKSPNHFRLNLYPKGINADFCDYLSIGLGAVSVIGKGEKITVRYRVSLINNKGERRNTKEWLYIFSSSKRVSVFGRFITRSELLDASNGLLLDDKLVIHYEGTVLGEPTPLDYANINLSDLKFIAKSQPDLMVEMLYNLATKFRLIYYSPKEIPNFEIQNQVDETFSYTHIALSGELSHSAWSNAKYNTRSTQELMKLSRGLMLDTLYYWMNSGTHVDLSFVLGHGDLAEQWNLHSIILLNRSSAFDALLQTNATVNDIEEKNTQVSIADAPIEVFDQLIQYLYTGKVPLLKEFKYGLLNVACEYGFDVLKQMCELAICDEITAENVIHTLIFANQVSAGLLKRIALNYITDHATELMFELDSLKPELIEEMYRNLVFRNSFKESEDRQVYENLQLKMVSNGIEESLSYTHLKKYHIFNEFTFTDNISDFPTFYVGAHVLWKSKG